ncbi:MAG: hypothetical protein IKM66_00435 [Clostridia bacterium]|nr:hypothetical protein [Clostridia bacterium]
MQNIIFDCEVRIMNLGTDSGIFGDAAPEYNRTLADFFTTFVQIFSLISAALKALFGTRVQ